MRRSFVPLLVLALATPVSAQQWQVARDQFAFAGRQLSVHVDAEVEGTLRVIRGPSGVVRVSGRSDAGMTVAGLTADEHLTLTAAGDGPVEFVITVPDRVWIDVRLPDRPLGESMGTMDRAGTFQWGAAVTETEETGPELGAPGPAAGGPAQPAVTRDGFTVFADDWTPSTVTLPDLTNIRSVTVRVEGTGFRVGASRPLVLYPGDRNHMEIRPSGPPMEIVVVVPAGTTGFSLSVGGSTALMVDGDQITVLCSPSTRQWLSDGRGWVTFTPAVSRLDCGPATDQRRRG